MTEQHAAPQSDDNTFFSKRHTAVANKSLVDQIEDLLPQTQCTKCGYPACRPYAEAIASGNAAYNQCPPGGREGIVRLARLLNQPVIPLNSQNGVEHALSVALIDEALCIGCTLCIQACPVDAIVGAPKQMHSVIAALCTGCDLCLLPCPVDCISMVPVSGNKTGWDAWSQQQADAARARHDFRIARLQREKEENDARLLVKAQEKLRAIQDEIAASPEAYTEQARKKAIINAAIARAQANKPKP